ncbi:hypothetical protein JCM9279_002203 [Rhodotorula babjevae]
MGAAVSAPQAALSLPATGRAQPGTDPFFQELGGEVVYDKSMGSSRFLKSVRARHKSGALVVKVFVKPDPALSLKPFHRRIKAERDALVDCPNVLAYGRALETERAGYLMRQWVASNLYDRISTRPFLTSVEKRWIAFQLLTGLQHARERGISHGDIKTENVVVTTWNWAYLADFSSAFKPTFLPLDDPSAFSFYFDTSSRRTCYLAPERFYAAGSDTARKKDALEFGKRDGKVTEAMDVFSLGCVLAELWMEGTPPFTLSQLFKYREGEYNLEAYLAEIEDVEIRSLIRSMVSLDPSARLSFADYLAQYRSTAFPNIFYTFLHPFLSSLNEPSSAPPPPTSAPHTASPSSARPGTSTPADTAAGGPQQQQQTLLRTDADDRIERVWTEWEMIARYLDETVDDQEAQEGDEGEARAGEGRGEGLFPVRLHLPGQEGMVVARGDVSEDGPALVVLSLVCANIRNCVRPASVLRALEILLALNRYLTDETRLDRLVPYLVSLLEDDVATVRSVALRALTQTLVLVRSITPSNVDVFPEYILPNTRPFSTDPEVLPRETYALCVAALAETAQRFLEMAEAMRGENTFELQGLQQDFEGSPYAGNFDARLQELHSLIQDHVNPLLSDPSSAVKRALLVHVGSLCTFFGRLRANDAVLAHLVTYLNTRDWLLRAAWNERAVDVASCVGARSLEEYILPLISLSLADPEEFVVVKVLDSLTTLAERRLLAKGKMWELVGQVTGFLCHPNIWIREGAAAFLATVASLLGTTDKWCILYPTVKRLLRSDIKDITDLALLDNAREPLSRVVFEAAVSWASRSGKSHFWSLSRGSGGPTKGAPRDASVRTDEDHAQLERMRQLGMSVEDEYKLSAMREYVAKVAAARQGGPSRGYDSPDALTPTSSAANLQDLGIVPQTIFFSVLSADEMLNQARSRLQGAGSVGGSLSRRVSTASSDATGAGRPSTSRRASASQAPVDDLRRRLALGAHQMGGGTTSSMHSFQEEDADGPDLSSRTLRSATPTTLAPGERLDLHRTVSQTSTAASEATATSTTSTVSGAAGAGTAKPRSRVRLNAVEVARAVPAVAEDSTNAMGLFDVEARYRASAGDADAASVMQDVVSQAPGQFRRSTSGREAPMPQRFVSTYEGNDPSIKQLLERTYLDSYREPLPELGPHVPVGIPRRKALRTSFPPRERTPTRPDGTLIAHLVEHTGGITSIQVSPDHLFFVTGSDDGTVKVWDAMRLEKNVTSRSRQTFRQGGKVTAVCVLEHSHCVASASTTGTVWIHRVDVSLSGSMPRYSKPCLIRQYPLDEEGDHATCLASFKTDTTTNLVLGTSLSSIIVLDVRTMRALQTFANPRHFGPITALCLDRKHLWLVAATASGVLTLWDLRFGLLLRSWSVGSRRINQIAVHPAKGKGRWIVVAAEPDESSGLVVDPGKPRRGSSSSTSSAAHGTVVGEVWDIDLGVKVDEFRVLSPQQAQAASASSSSRSNMFAGVDEPASVAMQDATLDPAAAIEALLAASTAPKPAPAVSTAAGGAAPSAPVQPTVRALLLGTDYSTQPSTRPATALLVDPAAAAVDGRGKDGRSSSGEGGFVLTGGEDRKLRFWDLAKPSRSAVVSGLDADEEMPSYSTHSSTVRPTLYLESPSAALSVASSSCTSTAPASRSSRSSSTSTSTSTAAGAPPSRVHRSTLIANSQQQLLRAHQEAITALAVLDLPFRCVVSGDRAGVVRVFE